MGIIYLQENIPAFARIPSTGAILPGRGIPFPNPLGVSGIPVDTPLQILEEPPFRNC